jgi:hypothetical protein
VSIMVSTFKILTSVSKAHHALTPPRGHHRPHKVLLRFAAI